MVASYSTPSLRTQTTAAQWSLSQKLLQGLIMTREAIASVASQPAPDQPAPDRTAAIPLKQLQTLSSNTLGYQLSEFLAHKHVDAKKETKEETRANTREAVREEDGIETVLLGSQTSPHFLSSLYVLTGYSTDALGMAELQAFLLGATGKMQYIWGCAQACYGLYQQGCESHPSGSSPMVMQRLHQAYQRGHASYFDPKMWNPEMLWDLPIQYVRRWVGI